MAGTLELFGPGIPGNIASHMRAYRGIDPESLPVPEHVHKVLFFLNLVARLPDNRVIYPGWLVFRNGSEISQRHAFGLYPFIKRFNKVPDPRDHDHGGQQGLGACPEIEQYPAPRIGQLRLFNRLSNFHRGLRHVVESSWFLLIVELYLSA